ncbi:hypothetical protein BBSC_0100 [Bifidobacterium scardovii JCM 12489 = DSM 13734]|nr:hypothetical protein BBSC_0100 [Bifidobacterium scardovii JCM 12489 = DSM 13734]
MRVIGAWAARLASKQVIFIGGIVPATGSTTTGRTDNSMFRCTDATGWMQLSVG